MRRTGGNGLILTLLLLSFVAHSASQEQSLEGATESATNAASSTATPARGGVDNTEAASAAPGTFLRNVVSDQKAIWSSPFKARIQDLNWLVPFAGLAVGLVNSDAELSSRLSSTGTLARHSGAISDAGLALAVGGTASLYAFGKLRSDDHQQETGVIAAEAAFNSLIVAETLKFLSRRQSPSEGTGQGKFGSVSPLNSSFPSIHATLAWSAAAVLSHEYPGFLTQTLAYGLATGVSVARVTGKEHFPSDVVVGAAIGWLVGRQAYAAHHDPELPGGGYGTFEHGSDTEANSPSHSSPYVPMDSWVYPAMDRLIALGAIQSSLVGLRPWTRAECARLLEEAASAVEDPSSRSDEVSQLYSSLQREFASEIEGNVGNYASLDSVYSGITGISGEPLTDGYHFGQTIVNNFGRPYQEGVNTLNGFSGSGSVGALGFYIRGEMEHAPSAPGVSQSVQDAIQVADAKTINAVQGGPPIFQPAAPIPTFNQFRLLDTYLMLSINGWQISFGKQTLWTGPTQDPFLWSSNAEPIYMLRLDQSRPSKLPGFLGFLGPVRSEVWVGKLTGQHYVSEQNGIIAFTQGRALSRQPMVNGVKINFKPTPNFEFGVGRTGLWGGPDFPITLHTTLRSFFATTNEVGPGNDPGDRRSTCDFTYRIPGVRNWLTLYDDSFVEDELSPIGYPRRAAHNPGVYLSHFPGLRHLDFRAEAAYTNLPGLQQPVEGGFFYWNTRYLDGYTNAGNIIGNATVGRQGISLRLQSTYWFGTDRTIQVGYRSNIVDSMFLEGGNLRDFYVRSEWKLRTNISLSSFVQYEYWNFPLLTSGRKQNDLAASLQVTYWPHWRFKRGS